MSKKILVLWAYCDVAAGCLPHHWRSCGAMICVKGGLPVLVLFKDWDFWALFLARCTACVWGHCCFLAPVFWPASFWLLPLTLPLIVLSFCPVVYEPNLHASLCPCSALICDWFLIVEHPCYTCWLDCNPSFILILHQSLHKISSQRDVWTIPQVFSQLCAASSTYKHFY